MRQSRLDLCWTQKELAGICGVARTTIVRWEQDHFPTPKWVIILVYLAFVKWETGRVNPPKSALICTLFLKIIRSIGDRELQIATYPVNRREKLLSKSKKLDLIKDNLLRSQTEEVYRKAAKLMKEEQGR